MMATATLMPPGAKPVKPKVAPTMKAPTGSGSVQPISEPKPAVIEFYGGRPAYIGVDVWYCRHEASFNDEATRLETLPGKLFARGLVDPNSWTLSVHFYASAMPDAVHDIEFSETPMHGRWCWPVVPVAQKLPNPTKEELDTLLNPKNPPDVIVQPDGSTKPIA